MALKINSGSKTLPHISEWNIGEEWPGSIRGEFARNVLEITANGDELNMIVLNFAGIPKLNNSDAYRGETSLTWYGDDARFIVSALQSCPHLKRW